MRILHKGSNISFSTREQKTQKFKWYEKTLLNTLCLTADGLLWILSLNSARAK